MRQEMNEEVKEIKAKDKQLHMMEVVKEAIIRKLED
jgi:hypothetical protein